MSELARWFDPDVKPVRVGSYETRRDATSGHCYFSYWDGRGWHMDTRLPRFELRISAYQNRPWRGLKEKPE